MDHQFQGLYKADDGAALRFYEDAAQNNAASERSGRAVFDTVLYVEVITPGSKESAPVFELERSFCKEANIERPRRNPLYEKYIRQIEAFRSGNASKDFTGTPIRAWPRVTTALAAELEHAGVHTVEALAALPDSRLSAVGPGALALREQAQVFLSAASGNAPSEQLASENVTLKGDVERLETENKGLSDRITVLETELAQARAAPPPAAPPPALPDLGSGTPPPPAPPADTGATGRKTTAKAQGGNAAPII